ncbi:MAG TPA: hypothetical protein ENG71_04120 [Thermoplasmatales archaeon]|nr:hypothetical protein [Thermoplasmatales archaeon]
MRGKAIAFILALALIMPAIAFNGRNNIKIFNEKKELINEPQNVTVVVDIKRIRSHDLQNNKIYFKIYIDDEESQWWDQVFEGMDIWFEWPMAFKQVKYEENKVIPIRIEVWKKGIVDELCDISQDKGDYLYGKALKLFFNLTTGEWYGDDYLGDENGYGHSTGYEDGDYCQNDYEIWFDIYEWEEDGDRMTYWEKIKYGLNTSRDYSNIDIDGDGIPCDWEDKYGYNPVVPEEHIHLDPDEDGLDNIEEWETSRWLSDPFAQDIFIEVDFMKAKYPWQEDYTLPKESQYMICDAFIKHNITVHFDDGSMGGGGDLIPYDEGMDSKDLMAARMKYFLRGDPNYWRKGVFHYAIICSQIEWYWRPAGGRMFYTDSFVVGAQYVRNWLWSIKLQGSDYITAMASVFMHELGHNLGLFAFDGIDNESTRFPWQRGYWLWAPYKSCMNYRYVFKLVDYSNGDDKEYDQNDWAKLDLRRFDEDWWK